MYNIKYYNKFILIIYNFIICYNKYYINFLWDKNAPNLN